MPELTVDVIDECKKLFKLESLSVQKCLTNPLAHKFRLDIDGVVDKDNTSIVTSMALLQVCAHIFDREQRSRGPININDMSAGLDMHTVPIDGGIRSFSTHQSI